MTLMEAKRKPELHLVDADPDVVIALAAEFARFTEVRVLQGDLLACSQHAIVSPANSDGFMDGGIDRAIASFFGSRVERRVREAIARRPEGHLPVGASIALPTGHDRIPYLVVAPTMRTPEQVGAENSYRALRAVLRLCSKERLLAGPVYCPGLTTGVGGVALGEAAAAMARAYKDWLLSGA